MGQLEIIVHFMGGKGFSHPQTCRIWLIYFGRKQGKMFEMDFKVLELRDQI